MILAAVIVTYNRLEKLKKTLAAYASQTRPVDKIIVVDNASKEDTREFLKNWQNEPDNTEKVVVALETNMGGSGGFHYGMKKAMELGFDYLFIADDDAYPEADAFEKIEAAINKYHADALCTKVVGPKGISFAHRRTVYRAQFRHKERSSLPSDYEKEYFETDLFSFVGAVLSSKVVGKCGYPMKDYFIWWDDTEYAYRVHENFKIICVPSICVYHDCDESNGDLNWKCYYGTRNRLDTYKRHCSKWDIFIEIVIWRIKLFAYFFKDKAKYRIFGAGLKDFRKGKFGISETYKPGAKVR